MNLIGKTTINPVLFFTGKMSGYFTWLVFFMEIFNHPILNILGPGSFFLHYFSLLLCGAGLLIVVTSLFHLGSSTRLGLPSEHTKFKSKGIYRYSRNPMYLGFNLLTLAAILFTLNLVILLLGVYSITIYHFIIISEERFLETRFGTEYIEYKKKTRRYI
ncbi:MAG: isoprenylcysteine carboxylmethyltransferase family protein [Chrysiogenales bacterium]